MSYPEIEKRFKAETADHEMTVLHADGLYRHLRFRAPDTGFYWFDLITWPGKLAFVGDGTGLTFARVEDMFTFFRNPQYGINPVYWSEKLVTDRDSVKTFSAAKFTKRVAEALTWAEETFPGVTAAWAEHTEDHDTEYEVNAREALDDFTFRPDGADYRSKPFTFTDTLEWDLRDYDWWFLWACHAIVWGIGQYDASKSALVDA